MRLAKDVCRGEPVMFSFDSSSNYQYFRCKDWRVYSRVRLEAPEGVWKKIYKGGSTRVKLVLDKDHDRYVEALLALLQSSS